MSPNEVIVNVCVVGMPSYQASVMYSKMCAMVVRYFYQYVMLTCGTLGLFYMSVTSTCPAYSK